MALKASKTAHFGQAGIVVHADLQIRVAEPRCLEIELIGEPKHAGIAAQFQWGEKQITVRSDLRYALRGDSAKLVHNPAQAHEVAFVQRHQTDKAAGPRPPR